MRCRFGTGLAAQAGDARLVVRLLEELSGRAPAARHVCAPELAQARAIAGAARGPGVAPPHGWRRRVAALVEQLWALDPDCVPEIAAGLGARERRVAEALRPRHLHPVGPAELVRREAAYAAGAAARLMRAATRAGRATPGLEPLLVAAGLAGGHVLVATLRDGWSGVWRPLGAPDPAVYEELLRRAGFAVMLAIASRSGLDDGGVAGVADAAARFFLGDLPEPVSGPILSEVADELRYGPVRSGVRDLAPDERTAYIGYATRTAFRPGSPGLEGLAYWSCVAPLYAAPGADDDPREAVTERRRTAALVGLCVSRFARALRAVTASGDPRAFLERSTAPAHTTAG